MNSKHDKSVRTHSHSAKSGWVQLGMLFFGMLLICHPVTALASQFKEYELKAGFLFNFTHFIKWPPTAFPAEDTPFVLALVGPRRHTDIIQQSLRNEMINGRALKTIAVADHSQLAGAHMIFFLQDSPLDPAKIISSLSGHPVLFVGESKDFISKGGTINLVKQGNRVKFEINPKTANRNGLTLSSRLLKLAIIVSNP